MLLRMRWEMDRPNLRADHVVRRRLHRRLEVRPGDLPRRSGSKNVSWVWCPTAEGFIRGDAPAFYPGDDQVDWTCVDVYAGDDSQPIGELMGPFLPWAAQHPKPIVIGEFGVAKAWGSAGRAAWLRGRRADVQGEPADQGGRLFRVRPRGQRADQQFQLTGDKPAFKAFHAAGQGSLLQPLTASRNSSRLPCASVA